MTTRITLTASADEPGAGHSVTVKETFDQVMCKVFPLTTPSSNLEHQANMQYTKEDGSRVAIHPSLIGWIEEILPGQE